MILNPGPMSITATAIGGNSGGTDTAGVSGGTAGTASIVYNPANIEQYPLNLLLSAQGGNGVTGDGATASTSTTITSQSNVTIDAFANSDAINSVMGDPTVVAGGNSDTGGSGAAGTVSVTATGAGTTAGQSAITVLANAYGGSGGTRLTRPR